MSKNGTQYYKEDKECNSPNYFLVLFVQVLVEVNQLSEYAFGLGFLGQICSVGRAWLPKKTTENDSCSHSFSTTMFAHSLHMKHFPPQRQVISWVVTFPQVQHHIHS